MRISVGIVDIGNFNYNLDNNAYRSNLKAKLF